MKAVLEVGREYSLSKERRGSGFSLVSFFGHHLPFKFIGVIMCVEKNGMNWD